MGRYLSTSLKYSWFMHCVLVGLLFGSQDKHDTTNSDKLFGHGAVKMVVISIGGTYNQSYRYADLPLET
jgi:hypothetical protein